jgi:hypothetical protein
MPDIYALGVRRVSWSLQDGVPIISIVNCGTVQPEVALAIADAIYEAVDAARSADGAREPTLFDGPPVARTTDPGTSHQAAKAVRVHAASQKARLLRAYADEPNGMTDEEAAAATGLGDSGYWKRCSELRSMGWIARTGHTRVGKTGMAQEVCAITESGRVVLMEASKELLQ